MDKVRYEVEWCSSIPEMEDCPGEGDFDRAVYEVEYFDLISRALKRAKSILRKNLDAFGEVRITEQTPDDNPELAQYDYWQDLQIKYVSAGGVSLWVAAA